MGLSADVRHGLRIQPVDALLPALSVAAAGAGPQDVQERTIKFGLVDFPFLFANARQADARVDGPLGKALFKSELERVSKLRCEPATR